MKNYFSKPYEEVLKEFNTSKSGLSDKQVSKNLEKFGPNQLSEKKKDTVLQVFLSQFKDLLVS